MKHLMEVQRLGNKYLEIYKILPTFYTSTAEVRVDFDKLLNIF